MASSDKTEDTQDAEVRAVTEAALFEAFGGIRGMVETTVPGLVFVTIYTINHDLKTSAITALALSVVMGVARVAPSPCRTPRN